MTSKPIRPKQTSEGPIYTVAGGNHVLIELDREETDGQLDVIEVLAQPGGGPPPHSHAFAEWFVVREGVLTICEERDGTVVCTEEVAAGESFWVPPWVVHGTLNLTDSVVRFQTVGQPALMSGYFREAGVLVPDLVTPPEREPAGPAELAEIAARWEVKFWTGPFDRSPREPDSSD